LGLQKIHKKSTEFLFAPQTLFFTPDIPNLPFLLLRKQVCKVQKTGTPQFASYVANFIKIIFFNNYGENQEIMLIIAS
jgi:hypothetical protein